MGQCLGGVETTASCLLLLIFYKQNTNLTQGRREPISDYFLVLFAVHGVHVTLCS